MERVTYTSVGDGYYRYRPSNASSEGNLLFNLYRNYTNSHLDASFRNSILDFDNRDNILDIYYLLALDQYNTENSIMA